MVLMETNMCTSVDVHSVLTVVSSKPVTPGMVYRVNPFDHAMGKHTLHIILYYKVSIPFEKIRSALNEILSSCPFLTGRLHKDGHGNWEMKCNDAGIRVFLAKVGTTVDEWLRSASSHDEINLTASNDLPDDPQFWSPFRIQVSEFQGGGTSIAMTCPHMLADPTSLTIFMKSWSETHLNQPILYQPYLLPLALHSPSTTTATATTTSTTFYATKSKKATLNPNDQEASATISSTTFCFLETTMKQLLSGIPDASPFDVLAALFLTRVANVRGRDLGPICISLDIRKRMDAPLPYGYFGNALHFSQLMINGGDLSHVARVVHRHVESLKEEEFRSGLDWFHARKDEGGKFDPPFKMYGPEVTCVNMEHLMAQNGTHSKKCEPLMYMVKFEKDEKPVHVSYRIGNVDGEGLIMVMPSVEGGLARRVAVTLPRDEMDKLLKDEILLGLEPSLILCGKIYKKNV